MVCIMFSLIDFDKKVVYNQSYSEKDFCLKPSKKLENLYFNM